jgi:hypothetical protein
MAMRLSRRPPPRRADLALGNQLRFSLLPLQSRRKTNAIASMRTNGSEGSAMTLKAFLAAAAAAAIAIGLALPVPHKSQAEPKSQFATVELGPG